jgi:hypothetical protein
MMILTLAVLGMVLGSFAVVQPVKASGPYIHFTEIHGCSCAEGGECFARQCPRGPTQIECDL